jgi:hypothetical protein
MVSPRCLCSHRALWRKDGARHSADASIQGCAFAQKRRLSQVIAQHADQRKRAGGNQTKGTDDEKSQEDRDFLFAGLRRHQRSRCTLSIKTCHGPPLRSRLKKFSPCCLTLADDFCVFGTWYAVDLAAYALTDWPAMQALTRAAEGLSGSCRDAGRRDKDQAQVLRADAPQELPNRRPTSLRNGAANAIWIRSARLILVRCDAAFN